MVTSAPIFFGIVLGITHYFSEQINIQCIHCRNQLVSFTAGISITYLLLVLLPETHSGAEHLNELLFFFMLVGIVIFHLIEKRIYQHTSQEGVIDRIKDAHSVAFFIYHFIIGIMLVYLIKTNILGGVLFFIPILSHSVLSNVSLREVHIKIREKSTLRLLLSGSTLVGVLLAYAITIPLVVYYSVIGFISGALLYIVIRDELPEKKEGDPHYFLMGVILYSLIIGLTR